MFSSSSYSKFWLSGLMVLVLAYCAYLVGDVIILIVMSLMISLGIESFIVSFTRIVKHRLLAIAIVYLIFVVFVLMGIVLIIPIVIGELTQIGNMLLQQFVTMKESLQVLGIQGYISSITRLPDYTQQVLKNVLSDQDIAQNIQSVLMQNISDIVTTSSGYVGNIGSFAVGFVSNFISIVFQAGLCLILAIFFSVEKDHIIQFVSSLGGPKHQVYILHKIQHLYEAMGLWFKGQFVLCIVIAVIVAVFLGLLALGGMDLGKILSLALIAGFTEFIPYIGPMLGAIPAVLIASLMFGWKGLIIVGLGYFCIQRLENNILIPLIMKKTMGVNPLLIFLCMVIAGTMIGFMGIVLAIPIAQILTIIYHERIAYIYKNSQT